MVVCLRCSNLRPGLRLRSISLLVFMIVISFCFHKLDSDLIHCCEERIKALEKGIELEYRLIEKSDEMTNENNRREKGVINRRYTYTEIFSILTVFVSASGVIYILLRFISAI